MATKCTVVTRGFPVHLSSFYAKKSKARWRFAFPYPFMKSARFGGEKCRQNEKAGKENGKGLGGSTSRRKFLLKNSLLKKRERENRNTCVNNALTEISRGKFASALGGGRCVCVCICWQFPFVKLPGLKEASPDTNGAGRIIDKTKGIKPKVKEMQKSQPRKLWLFRISAPWSE